LTQVKAPRAASVDDAAAMEEPEKLRRRARQYRAMAQLSPPALRDVRMRLASYLEALADRLEDAGPDDGKRAG
jgi:hypothetical protein